MENICLLQPSMAPFCKPLEVLTASLDLVSKRNRISALACCFSSHLHLSPITLEDKQIWSWMAGKGYLGSDWNTWGSCQIEKMHPRTRLGLTASPWAKKRAHNSGQVQTALSPAAPNDPWGSFSFAGVALHSSQPHFCTLSCLENPWLLPGGIPALSPPCSPSSAKGQLRPHSHPTDMANLSCSFLHNHKGQGQRKEICWWITLKRWANCSTLAIF